MLRYLLIHRLEYNALRDTNRGNFFKNFINKQTHKKDANKSNNADKNIPIWTSLAAVGVFAPNLEPLGQQSSNTFHPQKQLATPFGQFPNGPFITWNQFCYQMLARGEVEKVIIDQAALNSVKVILHHGAIVNGIVPYTNRLILQVPDLDKFEDKLREFERTLGIGPGNGIPVIYQRNIARQLITGLVFLAAFGYFLSKAKFKVPQNIFSSISKAKFTLVDPATRSADVASIRFRDVAGLQEAKVEVMEFVDYLKDSERFLKLGAKLPKGVLLTGPPGCGKTLLAKAVATEANVPFLALSGSDFVEMIGGLGASRVRSLFKDAKKLAPCIIYIDEIDSIGRKRGGTQFESNNEREQTLNQLLVEMDGMVSRKGVILLASTNRDDVLDKALTRPGRFDRQILIDLPNLEERREIFEKHASKIKLDDSPSSMARRMAQLTPGMSGADLANVCNEAALHAARKDKISVSASDLEYAIERVVGGTEKRSSSMSAEEKRIIAYHESGHALVGWLLQHTDPLLKVSIIPRTSNVLGFAQYLPSDQKLYNRDQLFERMCMALGGRVAELIKFNHLSTGAQDDLKKVTQMAMAQIKVYGLDPVIGHISFPNDEERLGKSIYSKRFHNLIDLRAKLMVKRAFDQTQQLLNKHLDKLDLLAGTLLTKEVLNTSDIEKLIGPRPFKNSSTSNKTT